ncbi:uncharacterized protein F5891DRAFT_1101054 [Suillus fuscotomentosus]|uniref:Uncharacterized protein n=1 Tax=Suillus fuscotomentosus TaxID=1912939 RepID=A0AAD4EI16_9AGAM|nr:uncharacterized protein F5891DRAFT_1101054 [Suillus fuscotomentosus]KAG1906515.1 hypothetical protein F5891DRAFT_1101054 [Suillus fuscotomentosus]
MSGVEPSRRPPLAGKPPFATDDPDELFDQPSLSKRRVRQPAEPNPNDRTSAYNMYDQYLDGEVSSNRQSGFGAVGLGFMTGDLSDDEDEEVLMHKPPMVTESKHGAMNASPIPLAAPRPGYPAPISALNIPSPAATPEMRQTVQHPPVHQPPQPMPNALKVNHPPADIDIQPLRMPVPIYETPSPRPSVPNTPHPLQPPMTPITPVFARPAKLPAPRNIQYAGDTIIRGGSEDNLVPRRGQKGDDFWRRFSIVAKDEKKTSSWLIKTQNGSSKLSRWVWFIGIMLLVLIAAGIGIGWYISHKSTSTTVPKAIGGSANETMNPTSTRTSIGVSSSSSLHVSPTNTVARRNEAAPTPAIREAVQEFLEEVGQVPVAKLNVPAGRSWKHRRRVEIQF